MKKILCIVMALAMVLSLCACGAKNENRVPPEVTEKTELIEKGVSIPGIWVVTDVQITEPAEENADAEAPVEGDAAEAPAEEEAAPADEAEAPAEDETKDAAAPIEDEKGEDEEAVKAEEGGIEALMDEGEDFDFDLDFNEMFKHLYIILNEDGTGKMSIAGMEDEEADAITWKDNVITDASGSEIPFAFEGDKMIIADEEGGMTLTLEKSDKIPEPLDVLGMLGIDLSEIENEADADDAEEVADVDDAENADDEAAEEAADDAEGAEEDAPEAEEGADEDAAENAGEGAEKSKETNKAKKG